MNRSIFAGLIVLSFILMSVAGCSDDSKQSSRSKSDWSSQSMVDDIESMKKAGEKNTPKPDNGNK